MPLSNMLKPLKPKKEEIDYQLSIRKNAQDIQWGFYAIAFLFACYGLWVDWFRPYAIIVIIGLPTLAFLLRWYLEGKRLWFPWQENPLTQFLELEGFILDDLIKNESEIKILLAKRDRSEPIESYLWRGVQNQVRKEGIPHGFWKEEIEKRMKEDSFAKRWIQLDKEVAEVLQKKK